MHKDQYFCDIALKNGFISQKTHLDLTEKMESGQSVIPILQKQLSPEVFNGLVRLAECSNENTIALERSKPKDEHGHEAESKPATELSQALDSEGSTYGENNRYNILGEKGRGGIGRVLLAFDKQIGREVAIKELLPRELDFASEGKVKRFLREARVTGQLEHPSIIPVYEIGQKEDGAYYYSMRLIKGVTLTQAIADARTFQKRLHLLPHFRDICNAIAYAHSNNIIHRDLKPDNIMIGEFGETVVLDWGIVKVKAGSPHKKSLVNVEAEDTDHVAVAQTYGTPAYMSPEQILGETNQVGMKSDIYSLGAILYEILTGDPPFTGETTVSILYKAINKAPVPVNERISEAPSELSAIAEKSLMKQKADRYKSVLELKEEIENYMSGEKVSAYEYSSWDLVRRFAVKNKVLLSSICIIFLMLIVSTITVTTFYKQEVEARKREALIRTKNHYHIAQAMNMMAENLTKEKKMLSARIYSVESLNNNPANPKSQFFNEHFASEHFQSLELKTSAYTKLYKDRFRLNATLINQKHVENVVFRCLDVSADHQRLVYANNDHIVLQNLREGTETLIKSKKFYDFYSIRFSPDGSCIVLGNWLGQLIKIDARSGQLVPMVQAHDKVIMAIAFSPDGKTMATASWDGSVVLWDSSNPTRTLQIDSEVWGVSFSDNGAYLACSTGDGRVVIWETADWSIFRTLNAHEGMATRAAFLPNSTMLASCGGIDETIVIWNIEKSEILLTYEGHTDKIMDINFSPDGAYAVSVGWDMVVRIWDVKTGESVLELEGYRSTIWEAQFFDDMKKLATASDDGDIKIWEITPPALKTFQGHKDSIWSLDIDRNGEHILSSSTFDSLKMWNIHKRCEIFSNKGHKNGVLDAKFSSDGRYFSSAGYDGLIKIWDAETGELIKTLSGHKSIIWSVAFSPDGKFLVSGSNDMMIKVWATANWDCVLTITQEKAFVNRVAFSPDSQYIGAVFTDRTARTYHAGTGKPIDIFKGHTDDVTGISYAPNGNYLFTSGKDTQVMMWDLNTKECVKQFKGHTNWVYTVKTSPCGKYLATASDDQSVKLWDIDSGQQIYSFNTNSAATAVVFSSDSKIFFIGDGTEIKQYPLDFSIFEEDLTLLRKNAEKDAGLTLEGFQLRSTVPE